MKGILRFLMNLKRSMFIALTFAWFIGAGTLLLMLPISNTNGQWLPFIDALFTATSASCVTGLAVVDTGKGFTYFGQTVLILLIQIGGLGIMTITSLLSVGMGKRIDIKHRLLIQESLNQDDPSGVIRMTMNIVKYTLCIEFFFGTVMALYFYESMGLSAFYWGYWHSVSAFCNAGFDLMGNFASLVSMRADIVINFCFMMLIMLGGLGFTVIGDVLHNRKWRKLSLHTKLVLCVNTTLVFGGGLMIWLLEHNNEATLGGMSVGHQLMASLFQSISLRTAGFNTIDIASLSSATLFLMMALMFIGASSTSTGGGIKTTTFAVLVASTAALLRDKKDVVIFHRRLEPSVISKATSVFLLAFLWICLAIFLLMVFDDKNQPFQFIMFEVFSAMGTVGMGVGITTEWNSICKFVLIMTMYVGRIGILTFSMSFFNKKIYKLRYPTENVLIG